MYKHIFGPVPSRRLGMSLGIDLMPKKICSLNCIYCEVGETTLLTAERKEYIPFSEVKDELIDYFNKNNQQPDYITFSGSGEPTLNNKIGEIIEFIKEIKPEIPLAVLTNGTLLSDSQVRKALLKTDIVLPSLDAVTQNIFELVNRPDKSLRAEDYIRGLIEFRREYRGKIYLEVFILPDYNDSEEHIYRLKEVIRDIGPDKVQLNTLDRPGTIKGIRATTETELERIIKILDMPDVEVIADVKERKNMISYREDAETAILGTIERRPCTPDDLSRILGLHINEINKYLDVLEKNNRIEVLQQERGFFYKVK